MSNSANQHTSLDTLVAVMSADIKNLIKSVDKIERGLENKVDLSSFHELKNSFEDHKKETTITINNHTMKIYTGVGLLIGLSFILNLLK